MFSVHFFFFFFGRFVFFFFFFWVFFFFFFFLFFMVLNFYPCPHWTRVCAGKYSKGKLNVRIEVGIPWNERDNASIVVTVGF